MAGQAVSLGGSIAQPPIIPGRISRLGGGMPGFIPQALINTNNNYEFVTERFMLKQAWNTNHKFHPNSPGYNCTPFRRVNNAGDLYTRKAYSCGGPCQTPQMRANLHGLKKSFGHISDRCDGSFVEPASCNVKFVYDNSDYVRFLKQKAIVKNYNDLTYGGDSSHANQSVIRAIRRY
jgi:hypothetical protein